MASAIDEKRYRHLLDDTFARVDRAFEDVDPDLAEVSVSQGTLTITYLEKQRLMLTPQPSPRQLWVAFRDRAWHFDWDDTRATWLDDRGEGVDLHDLLEATTRDVAKVSIKIARNLITRGAAMSQPQSNVVVEVADRVTPELEEAFAKLLPQLSSSGKLPPRADMEEMIMSPATQLLVARSDGKIIGMLMLVLFRIPTGLRAWIEDVVVDGEARGKGAGEALTRAAVASAIERGARTVDLTSRPSREAANRLYQRSASSCARRTSTATNRQSPDAS